MLVSFSSEGKVKTLFCLLSSLPKRSMAMVSEHQSGNLDGAPHKFLQFPTTIATDGMAKKKLKIKIASKHIDTKLGMQSCEVGHRMFTSDEYEHKISVTENKKGTNKLPKLVLLSSDSVKMKSSAPVSHKRGSPEMVVCQKDKKRKMDRVVTQQCSVILKMLMTHPAGWVFNQPVNPVKLGIPDYFSIITEPMDLGTVKTKLEKHEYFTVEEFATDVRLTFSNAMQYNPPGNNVHLMAMELNNIFNSRWKCLEERWNPEVTNVRPAHKKGGRPKNTHDTALNCHRKSPLSISLLPKRLMSAEEKDTLRQELVDLLRGKVPQDLRGFLRKFGLIFQKEENIEVDIGAFEDETLWELKRVIRSCWASRAAKAEPAKATENGGRQLLVKIVPKGTDSIRSASGSAITKPPLSSSSKCCSCGGVKCDCSLQNDSAHTSASDLSSVKSLGQESRDGCRTVKERQNTLTTQMSKSDPEIDVDEENVCSSPQLSTRASTAGSGEGWTPPIDVQLSPKKALRAAILKSRFADTILKAQHKTLLDHGDKADLVKMQKEKERLERLQREEKARIEAQIRAAEEASRMRAEAELKLQREKEREAARLALQKMEKTVQIDNLEILKDLEMFSECSLSDCFLETEFGSEVILGCQLGNPLERLGLFMKDDYLGDEDDEGIVNGDGEEGEIF